MTQGFFFLSRGNVIEALQKAFDLDLVKFRKDCTSLSRIQEGKIAFKDMQVYVMKNLIIFSYVHPEEKKDVRRFCRDRAWTKRGMKKFMRFKVGQY